MNAAIKDAWLSANGETEAEVEAHLATLWRLGDALRVEGFVALRALLDAQGVAGSFWHDPRVLPRAYEQALTAGLAYGRHSRGIAHSAALTAHDLFGVLVRLACESVRATARVGYPA